MAFELTPEQLEVIKHKLPGHGRLLAGPGTGKSTTAIALLEKLLDDHNGQIKLKFITFTRASALELATKLSKSKASSVSPSTIHSFALSILLQNPGCAPFPLPLRIPNSYEDKNLIRPYLADKIGINLKEYNALVTEMSAKWESLDPQESTQIDPQIRARFIGAFNDHRRMFGYTLIDEIPDLARKALLNNDNLKGIDYNLLIVDEYQDLNACELEFLKLLSNKSVSIFSCGDDDQSIYRSRKAHPQGIRNFLNDYNTTNDYKLTICQRSPKKIIDWSQSVIQGDTEREPRNPPSYKDGAPDGVAALLQFGSEITEANNIASLIVWLSKVKKIPLSEILIVSRTDRYGQFTKPIKEALTKLGIECSKGKTFEEILNEEKNRICLALLRLFINRKDSLALWTLIEAYDGIGPTFINYLISKSTENGTKFGETFLKLSEGNFVDVPTNFRNKIIAFWNGTKIYLENMTLTAEKQSQWGKQIIEQMDKGALPVCDDDLKEILKYMDKSSEEEISLDRYLSQIAPLSKDYMRISNNGVRFMTITSSKGLTSKVTIVLGVDNDLIPHPKADRAEERRLLYVAMTRPTDYLFLTWANIRRGSQARSGNENTRRRFYSDFLSVGSVESQNGIEYVKSLYIAEPIELNSNGPEIEH
jgi:DNA helicase-2/ATP-dependent DNA helicase PcrA